MHRYEKGLLHGLKQWLRLCLLRLHRSRRKGEKEQRKEAGCDWQKKKKRVTFFSPFGTSPQTACHVPQLLRPLARENQKRRQKQNDLSFEGIKKKKKGREEEDLFSPKSHMFFPFF